MSLQLCSKAPVALTGLGAEGDQDAIVSSPMPCISHHTQSCPLWNAKRLWPKLIGQSSSNHLEVHRLAFKTAFVKGDQYKQTK